MTTRARVSALVVVAATWCIAAAPLPLVVRSVAGFTAVFLLPGLMLGRAFRGDGARMPEEPARALVLSVAFIGILGVACSALGCSVTTLNVALVSATLVATAAPVRRQPTDDARTSKHAREPLAPVAKAVVTGIAVLTAATIVLAALDVNIARDRMWYAAYVTKLASGRALDWHDPVLGSGRVIWRFACNAWLLALGSWSALAHARAPWLIERCAPPLLVGLVPLAAYDFALALFRDRERALLTTLCTIVVLLASSYPYFAPEHTPLFIRLVEDKTAALLLLAPVATALAIRTFTHSDRSDRGQWVVLALALLAVALAHAIVYLIACISLVSCALWSSGARTIRAREALPALAIAAAVALAPLALGAAARRDALHVRGGATVLAGDITVDPVVRAHLRMHRLHDLPVGGPIVEPELLADPVLVAATIGIAAAASAGTTIWGAYACSTTIVFFVLSFAPFIAPLFGRVVVPWMAYRALWGVPFGLLLAGGLLRAAPAFERSGDGRSPNTAVAIVAVLIAVGLTALPWIRLREKETRLAPDAATLRLIDAITGLPQNALIAAAPGLSELVPAYGGRAVLAFADRGTTAFAARRGEAERRLRANAAIVALHGTARRSRLALLAARHVTHVVLERERCERGMREVYGDGRFTICEVQAQPRRETRIDVATADARWIPEPGIRGAAEHGDAIADLSHGISCAPAPIPIRGYNQWRRESRWSGRFTSVECSATFAATSLATIVLRGQLPHARDALVYSVKAVGKDGRCARSGSLELMRDRSADIPLRCENVTTFRIRFASAYLPYMNLKNLALYAR